MEQEINILENESKAKADDDKTRLLQVTELNFIKVGNKCDLH